MVTRPTGTVNLRYSALSALITSTRDALVAGTSDARIAAATSTVAAPIIGTGPGISTSEI
jgi:hypothetical protein